MNELLKELNKLKFKYSFLPINEVYMSLLKKDLNNTMLKYKKSRVIVDYSITYDKDTKVLDVRYMPMSEPMTLKINFDIL